MPHVSPEMPSAPEDDGTGTFIETQRTESALALGLEAIERQSELSNELVVSDQPSLQAPIDNTPIADDTKSTITDNTANPVEARDSDLIEKEWVVKAKQILSETKDDPYGREERVKALQADYLEKRYNRKLGDNN